jgi:hypothetical protein
MIVIDADKWPNIGISLGWSRNLGTPEAVSIRIWALASTRRSAQGTLDSISDVYPSGALLMNWVINVAGSIPVSRSICKGRS